MGIRDIFKFIYSHPLNNGQEFTGLARFLKWQFGSRILGTPVVWPFVNDSRLIISRGMTAATGNIYVGLMAFEEMGFILHYLRPGDVFFDVGANVGTYTVLASKAVGAQCVSVEPDSANYAALLDNIYLNRVQDRVKPINIAVGSKKGSVRFCAGMGAISRILSESDPEDRHCYISVMPLDDITGELCPEVLKIDTEGYEHEVLAGGARVLGKPSLNAVLMELRGHGARYGFDEKALDQKMRAWGFKAYVYDPLLRSLSRKPDSDKSLGDMLYIRNIDKARTRIAQASKYKIRDNYL